MRQWLITALLMVIWAGQAQSEPILRIINFTADWCPNCRILNPLMEEALLELPTDEYERVDLDMTKAGRRNSEHEKTIAWAQAVRTAQAHQAGYLWDWYGGVTGLAVIISADNGEPISCFNRTLTSTQIAERLRQAKIISLRRPPGTRMPDGPDCPPPFR